MNYSLLNVDLSLNTVMLFRSVHVNILSPQTDQSHGDRMQVFCFFII